MYRAWATLYAGTTLRSRTCGEWPAWCSKRSSVLVTGTSTGIGRKITEPLAADGYFVYATARKDEDLKALAAIKNVQAVRLDVTQPADIAAAVDLISKAGRGLYALVNNAGVATYGAIADMSQLLQLNEGQPHTYERAALIKMLDAALSTARPRTK